MEMVVHGRTVDGSVALARAVIARVMKGREWERSEDEGVELLPRVIFVGFSWVSLYKRWETERETETHDFGKM